MASKIYKSLVGIAKLRSIHRATLPKSVTVLFQRSPPAQDAIWLAGWICSRSVAIIVHCCTQYLSDHMHQVVAGSGGNTIDLALLSTGTNEEYIKVSVPLKHSTKALNTTSNSWKNLPRTPHIPILLPPTKSLLHNIQE